MQRSSMFYGAPPHIFEKAKELRNSMTEAEQLLWERLRKSQLLGYKFRRQHPVSEFIADFYCHAAKLVVEVDGGIHKKRDQKEYDFKRTGTLNEFGITVIRFTNEQIENDIDEVLKSIENYLST